MNFAKTTQNRPERCRSRRRLITLLALLGLAALDDRLIAAAERKTNLVLILTDDQGYGDVGAQGHADDVRTPHLDRLAREGVRCAAGYVTAPQCSPSRAGLLTGRYQQRFGLGAAEQGMGYPDPFTRSHFGAWLPC